MIEADAAWRKALHMNEQSKKQGNDCSRAIAAKKKAKEADGTTDVVPEEVLAKAADGSIVAADLQALCVLQIKSLSKWYGERTAQLNKDAADAETKRDALLGRLGNIVHESVPVEVDEDKGNEVVRTFGETGSKPLNHVDIMEKLGFMDCGKNVTAMAGGRAYVLRGPLVQLQNALISYALAFLVNKEYTPFYPPLFLNKQAMGEVAQLSQFDDELYKVSGEGDDKYLIATSEQPIAAYHRGKWFQELPKPIKYAGVSTCFRKEVGSHGRDTLGIFRVHQFDKIEQFIVCSPHNNESWKLMDDMINNAEEFYKSLDIPYRVVNICSGALNNAAAKKYDLEAWFPGSGAFRELVSCSNCTDYQSRRLNCRFGESKRGSAAVNIKEHPHMLNSTLCAVTRVMCAICENNQTEEGIVITQALRPFMMGKEIIKYSEAADIVDKSK